MDKAEAIKLLGDSCAAAARAVGVSPQAVSAWPDQLPDRIRDRVQAALWRAGQAGVKRGDVAAAAQQ
jgi:hypothetical protein